MSPEFESVFVRLRSILEKHAGDFAVGKDVKDSYALEGHVGPATLRAWGGKMRKPRIPVAWVGVGKAYVSFHLMPLYGNAKLAGGLSKALKARMQGKSCFNFTTLDEALLGELEEVTRRGLTAFKKAGFVARPVAKR